MAAALQFDQVLDSIRAPNSVNLSPALIAKQLDVQLQELATLAGVHRNTIRTHPESPQVQRFLRDVVRVLSAASELQSNVTRSWFLIKNAPIREFNHRTLLTIISEGRADDAIAYIESVSPGFVG